MLFRSSLWRFFLRYVQYLIIYVYILLKYYISDWACGGQWNRMVQFLSLLTQAIERGNIELAVVFNGTTESCRMNEWIAEQANVRQKVGMVKIV